MQISVRSKHSNTQLKEIVVKIDNIHIKSICGEDKRFYEVYDNSHVDSFSYVAPHVTYIELIFTDGWVQVYRGFEADTTKMRLLQWGDILNTIDDSQEKFYIKNKIFILYSLYKIGTTYNEERQISFLNWVAKKR